MAEIEITQAEADSLIAMEKWFVDENEWTFPVAGERIGLTLASLDKGENFMLDVTRAQIKLTKAIYQNRAQQVIVLMRLDLDGPPHRNPDGTEIRTGPKSAAPTSWSTLVSLIPNCSTTDAM